MAQSPHERLDSLPRATMLSETNTWFSSDWSIGDPKAASARGFQSQEDHDQWIFGMIDNCITHPRDLIWVLGDVGVWTKLAPLQDIKCRMRLVYGTDDRCHPIHLVLDPGDYQTRHYRMFEIAVPYSPFMFSGKRALLANLPYDRDPVHTGGNKGNHDKYRLSDLGLPLVHGHIRRPEKTSWSMLGSAQLNVAPDAWQGLVPVSEVQQFIDKVTV